MTNLSTEGARAKAAAKAFGDVVTAAQRALAAREDALYQRCMRKKEPVTEEHLEEIAEILAEFQKLREVMAVVEQKIRPFASSSSSMTHGFEVMQRTLKEMHAKQQRAAAGQH
jgi:K+/H+ antiporter YhaU regulatory subunit KhtT